jgi:hypothetical protein
MSLPLLSTYPNSAYTFLSDFALSDLLWTNFTAVYGNEYNLATAEALRSRWASQDFTGLPTIEVVSGSVLGPAMGAYAASNNTIYLADTLLASAVSEQVVAVILEEIGHYVDTQVNGVDPPRDEGEYFARVVLDQQVSEQEVSRLQAENDWAVATIDGVETAIEQNINAAPILTIAGDSIYQQIGADIDGEAAGDYSGSSVSLSADGSVVVIGTSSNDGNGSSSGHVRIYQNVNGTWTQVGSDIDDAGHLVSLSADGSVVVIGASSNDGNGTQSGHVRIYQVINQVSVTENQTAVTIATATDPDGATLTYSLGGDDASLFDTSNTGVVTFKTAPDFETPTDTGEDNTYDITVTASDGSLSSSQAVAITVTDVNEAPSITSGTTASFTENDTGTIYATTATDPDGDSLTYNLSGVDAARFNISNGEISFITAPDFETPTDNDEDNTYNITVTASDGSLNSSQDVAITVTDVDEFDVTTPTDTDSTDNMVAENAANGTAVGITVNATDGDSSNNTVTYSLTDDAEGLFAIDASTGVVTVADGSLLDFETATGHNITVQATSADSSTNTETFTINVTDVDENSSPTNLTLINASINENVTVGTSVGTFSTTDSDADNTLFTYSLVTGAGDTNNASFAIDGSTLKINVAPDYETQSSYSIWVKTTDLDGLSYEKELAITITDVNEAPTAVTLENAVTTLAEDADTTTPVKVADIAITDDAPGDETITLSGEDASLFEVIGTELFLKAGTVLDFETNSQLDVTVEVDDVSVGTTPDVTTTLAITIPKTQLKDNLTDNLIRFRNTDRPGTYLFAGLEEAISIRQNYKNFIEEGTAFQVATNAFDPLLQPFYRFQNTAPGREGTYLFAGAEEAASIRQNYKNFIEEGIAFYAYAAGVGGGTTEFSRFQNNAMPGTYLFAGPEESAAIVNNPNLGFTYEGVAFAAGG